MSIGKNTRKPVAAASAMPRTMVKRCPTCGHSRRFDSPLTWQSDDNPSWGSKIMLLPSNKVLDPDEVTVTRFKVLGASIAIILMARGAALAELTPGRAAADWMQSYGERNKECLEWTDTCVN